MIVEINPLNLDSITELWLRLLLNSYPTRSEFAAGEFTVTSTGYRDQPEKQVIKLTDSIKYIRSNSPLEIDPQVLDNSAEKWLIRLFASHPNQPRFHALKPILVPYKDQTGKSVNIHDVELTNEIVQWENARKEKRYGIKVKHLGKGAFSKGVTEVETLAPRPEGGLRKITYKSRAEKYKSNQAQANTPSEPAMLEQTGHLGRPKLVKDDHSTGIIIGLAEGDDLDKFLKEHGAGLSATERYELSIALLKAYKEIADKGVVHLDVKPANIRIKRTALGRFVVKFIDLGFAVKRGDKAPHAGTDKYMAPEMLKLKHSDQIEATPALDIPGLGQTLAEIWRDPANTKQFFQGNDLSEADQRQIVYLLNSMLDVNVATRVKDVNELLNYFQVARRNYLYSRLNDSARQSINSAVKLAKEIKEFLFMPTMSSVLNREMITSPFIFYLNQLENNEHALREFLYELDIPELMFASNEKVTSPAVLTKLETIFINFDSNLKSLEPFGDVERVKEKIKPGDHPWLIKETKNLFNEIEGVWGKFDKKKPSFQSVLELNRIFPMRFNEIAARYKKWEKGVILLERLAGIKRIQTKIKSENSGFADVKQLSSDIEQLWKDFEKTQTPPSVLELDSNFLKNFNEIEAKYEQLKKAVTLLKRLGASTIEKIQTEITESHPSFGFAKTTSTLSSDIQQFWKTFQTEASPTLSPKLSAQFAKLEARYKAWQQDYYSYFWNYQLPAELKTLRGKLKAESNNLRGELKGANTESTLQKKKIQLLDILEEYYKSTRTLRGLFLRPSPDIARVGNIERILNYIEKSDAILGLEQLVRSEYPNIADGTFGKSKLKMDLQKVVPEGNVVSERNVQDNHKTQKH